MRSRYLREYAFINMADELTDEELRRQLISYGAKTVGPITATTRPIYVKKLNHLKVAAKKPKAPAAKNKKGQKTIGFSSDDSEDETTVEPANRSRTVGGASRARRNDSTVTSSVRTARTPSKTNLEESRPYLPVFGRRPLRSTTNSNYDDSLSSSMLANYGSPGADTSFSRLTDRGRGSRLSGAYRPSSRYSDDLELSDSDADNENGDDRDETDRSYAYDSPEKVSVSVNTSSRLDDSSLFDRTLGKLSGVGSMWNRRQSYGRSNDSLNDSLKHERPSRPKSPVTVSEDPSVNHRPGYSFGRTSLGGGGLGGSTLFGNNRTHNTRSVPSTSQQNKVTSNMNNPRRRSQQLQHSRMSNHTPPNHISHDDDKLYEEENILQQGFKTKEDPSSYKISQNISMVLLTLAILFFVSLAGVYIAMNSPHREVAEIPSRDNWLICSSSMMEDGSSEVCYPREKVENARLIVLELAEMLSLRAGKHECGVSILRNMTRQEAKTRLMQKFGPGEFGEADVKKFNFLIALDLIIHNPHWRLSLCDRFGDKAVQPQTVETLESLVPYRGIICQVRMMAVSVVYYVAGIFSISMVIFLVLTFMRYRWRKQEEETRHVYQLVEQVIDMLMSHHERCQANRDVQPYLAIPHVRDMIIDPKERRSMQHLWDKAVKFLSANESRIRVETQKIAGEEFAVWRWLPTNTNGKVWQGSAFGEKNESNYSHYTPTQCLKIRNMFDPTMECEEDWHINIQDAILEKVMHANGSHGIVHITVDKTSPEGCVYIKCLSPEEAGKAYKALHGWWFDNSLITVKYLRLNRYYERFPEAVRYNTPLSPSNNQRRSLAQPFHHSIIESC